MANILEITHLTIKDNKGIELIHDVNLALKEGQVNVLVGESGSGKSLTAKAMVQQVPDMLNMYYERFCYNDHNVINVQALLGKDIGFISQDYTHSFNDHTKLGKQLIAIYRAHYKVEKSIAKQIVRQSLESVDLNPDEVMKRYRFSLSGGQLARVQIASVLMLKPKLLIADEPTASLDAITGFHVMHLIKHLAAVHGVTLLLITHNLSHVLHFSDWIHVIRHGNIIDSNHVTAFKEGNINPYSLKLFNAQSQLRNEGAYD